MVYLIEADFAVLAGNRESAMSKYDLSIASAGESKFLHVQALACERAALAWESLA
jgi:hypothetical protein